jgi:glycosyltransferase involved in cell wall biosynthesis
VATVSVVIPAYGTAETIGETLASVFAQTRAADEVIVVDDGSPDGDALERAVGPYLDRIRFIRKANGGVASARNAGAREASGDVLAFPDSDDVWYPRFLESQIDTLTATGAVAVWSDCDYFGDPAWSGRRFMAENASASPATFESLLRLESVPYLSGMLIRADALAEAGMFDLGPELSEDFSTWLNVSRVGEIRANREVLGAKRVRADGLSANAVALLDAVIRILDVYTREPWPGRIRAIAGASIRRVEADRDLEMAKRLLLEGRFAEAQARVNAANRVLRKFRLTVIHRVLGVAPGIVRRLYKTRARRTPVTPAGRAGS